MENQDNRYSKLEQHNNILRLRDHLRIIWKSYATSSHLIADTLEPGKATYLIKQNNNFHSAESSIYLYLVASQNLLRSSQKIITELENEGLKNMKAEMDEKFATIKTARDILEHFEDYGTGQGRLQKNNKVDIGESHLSIEIDEQGQRIIHVFNLGHFNMSDLDWAVDGLMHFIERRTHEFLFPNEKWQGWYPDQY